MTLMSTLKSIPDFELVALNFSSATTPELLLSTFDQSCEYRRTPSGTVLRPIQAGKWLVLFCDEVNLPALDKYGTQRVISFLRQLTEQVWAQSLLVVAQSAVGKDSDAFPARRANALSRATLLGFTCCLFAGWLLACQSRHPDLGGARAHPVRWRV